MTGGAAGARAAGHDPTRPTVAVVGGGVVGLSLAWALARRRVRPLVLEAAAIGARGASAVPVALLNPYRGRKGAAHPDDLRGLEATLGWADALRERGLAPGLHRSGVLRIPPDARQAALWRERHDPDGPAGAAWLRAVEVPTRFRAPFGALRVGRGGWLEPDRWLGALSTAACRDGGEVREHANVRAFEEGERDVEIVLDDGRLHADAAVLCIGADPPPHPRAPTLATSEGDVVTLQGTPPLPMPLAGAIYAASGGRHGRPLTWVGGHHRAPGDDASGAAEALREALARWVPDAADARIARTWSGVRARSPDTRPLVRWLSPRVSYLGGFAGRGFLCAADVAERHAEKLAGALGGRA